MLEDFDQALGMEGWPDDDAVIPFKPLYSETDGGMDVEIDAGVDGTFSCLKLDVAGPTPPTRNGRGSEVKSTLSQACSRQTKRKQSYRTQSIAQQTNVDMESFRAAAGLPTTKPENTATGWLRAEPPRKTRQAKNWSDLASSRCMNAKPNERGGSDCISGHIGMSWAHWPLTRAAS
ncbi:hypothetical protein WOLCODRAFT_159242 [Wolfiporia cocos MD-104 SS10]|uniref:Uncharacterized protein n=1 Tax=Wolfiporia cocos (strain MD-104) TaxID=742152 RepID=A0A2H3JU54_WOLCO|nr:hypothetical protein WOLCODRAFT_159242 [Wolfiporia cocos MD-104 SS10]